MSQFRLTPAINSKDAGAKKSGAPAESGDFKPLYAPRPEGAFASTHHDTTDSAALIESARLAGNQKGVYEGRDEARRMARAALIPGLRTFIERSNGLASENRKVEAYTHNGALELALAISQHIMGAPVSVSAERLDELKSTLKIALSHANRISLSLHPDDLDELRDLMHEENIPWPDHPQITVQPDASIGRHELQINTATGRDAIVDTPVSAKLAQLLSLPGQNR